MIKIRIYTNASCIKCGIISKEMIWVGSIHFCNKCIIDEFEDFDSFSVNSEKYKLYRKWLKVYYENN